MKDLPQNYDAQKNYVTPEESMLEVLKHWDQTIFYHFFLKRFAQNCMNSG